MTKKFKKPSKRGKKAIQKQKSLHCNSEIIPSGIKVQVEKISLFGNNGWFSKIVYLSGIIKGCYDLINLLISLYNNFIG